MHRQMGQASEILKRDHEQSRRIQTIQAIQQLFMTLGPKNSAADNVVRTFDESQCIALVRLQEVRIDSKYKDLLESCIGKECCYINDEGEFVTLRADEANLLRYHTVAYLNATETLLSAWQLNIVDKGTIENQFKYLYQPTRGYDTLSKFREAIGVEHYPSIGAFIERLKDVRDASIPKPKLPTA